MRALIEDLAGDGRPSVPLALNVLGGAAAAWLTDRRSPAPDRATTALPAVLWSWAPFAATAAWLGKNAGEYPSAAAARQAGLAHPGLAIACDMLLAAGIAAIAATGAAAVPFGAAAIRRARHRRVDPGRQQGPRHGTLRPADHATRRRRRDHRDRVDAGRHGSHPGLGASGTPGPARPRRRPSRLDRGGSHHDDRQPAGGHRPRPPAPPHSGLTRPAPDPASVSTSSELALAGRGLPGSGRYAATASARPAYGDVARTADRAFTVEARSAEGVSASTIVP
jgi:hypothetical protein